MVYVNSKPSVEKKDMHCAVVGGSSLRDSRCFDGSSDECSQTRSLKSKSHTRIDSVAFQKVCKQLNMKDDNDRLVVVRYFLDRPGYGLHNSAARLWFGPPVDCKPHHIEEFLVKQGIALAGLLVEIFLDKYESFMLLEACQSSCVAWDFSEVTYHEPGILNVRLTDMSLAEQEQKMTEAEKQFPRQAAAACPQPQYANPTPAGLFSFSMMVGLETVALLGKLVPGTVDPSYTMAWGPYMIFVGGLLQILVACFNMLRNNLYGAIAFFGFGCFWFSFGTYVTLKTYFAHDGTLAGEWLDNEDHWGVFFRSLFVFAFTGALWKQTFVMSKLSTTLIGLLLFKVGFSAFTGWSEACQWLQLIFGTITSAFAFFVFMVEFTNGVYHRDVFPTFKWSKEHSPEEVFGASGRSGTLFSKAARLRQASLPDVTDVRAAMDKTEREVSQRMSASERMPSSKALSSSPEDERLPKNL